MSREARQQLPSDLTQASRLRNSVIEAAKKRQLEHERLLVNKPTMVSQRRPSPVVSEKFEPRTEYVTEEQARALIGNYNPELLHRWQQSVIKDSSLKEAATDEVGDKFLYFKLCQQFLRLYGRMPETIDIVQMKDEVLEEVMASSKKKEEMTAIRQSMIQHNILSLDSQIVFEIDLLGLPERVRERLVAQNIKTIESICQLIGKKPDLDEEAIDVSISIKNQLLRFLQELAKWEKAGSSPAGLPTNLKQLSPEGKLEKRRQKTDISQEAHIYQEAKQGNLLAGLTSNQRTSLEMVFDQGLTIHEVARRLTLERGKTVLYSSVIQYIFGGLNRLKRIKNSPQKEKKELTGLAYLQVVFPGRLGTITYNTLKKNNINTLEELKNSFSNLDAFAGIGSKGMQAYVDLLRHFFPEEEFINPLSVRKPRIVKEKPIDQPLPQIDQQALEKWQESRQNEAKLDKIGLPDNILNVFQEAGWTLEKIINIPDDNLLRLLGGDTKKLIAVRKALINNNIISKNSDLTTELDLLGLPTNITRALIKANIKTLKELYSLTEKQLLFIKKIGPTSLGLIRLNLTRLKNELETIVPETGAADST